MGLADTSPLPKKDSMGMDYVPVYADDAPPAAPGTVVLPPDKVQALGVRTEAVRRGALSATVRTSGTVEVDETRQYAIAPRFEGWVERLYANQTGMRVRAGQRSEEHTSELQSLMRISYAVFCLKKKTKINKRYQQHS